MKMFRLFIVLVFGCFSLSAFADDEEFEPADVSVTSTTIIENRTNNKNDQIGDDDYVAIFERFNVSFAQGDFETRARIDGAFFIENPDVPLNVGFEQNLQLERLITVWTLDDYNIVLSGGDFFEQVGRGIALSLRKQNEAGVDVALRGARLFYEDDNWSARLFGGVTNPANIDAVNQRFVEDARDIIAGGEALLQTSAVRFGSYALYSQPKDRILEDNLDFNATLGVTLDAVDIMDWLTVYAEGAVQARQLAGANAQGSALYLNADARAWGFTFNVESMWLSAFEQRGSSNTALGNRFSYNQPPTLERIDQEIVNNRDVLGLRLRAEYFFEDLDLLLYVNTVGRVNDGGDPAEVRQSHTFAGVNWTLPGGGSRLAFAGGYRDEARQVNGERVPLRNMRNVDADWLQSIGGGFSVHTTHQAQFWEFEERPFVRGSSFLGLEKGGLGSVTFEFGYDTQNASRLVQKFFYAGIVSLELPTFDLLDSALFRGSLGTQRGGIKCVAGVCREFPSFSGARGELITRF